MMPGRAYQRAVERRRRSLQLRVVATTLIVSATVVAIVGLVVASQVRDTILSAKTQASLTQAGKAWTSFSTTLANSANAHSDPTTLGTGLYAAVQAAKHQSGGDRNVVALTGTGNAVIGRIVDPTLDLGYIQQMDTGIGAAVSSASTTRAWQYTRIVYSDGRRQSGLVVVQPVTVPTANAATTTGQYRLYLFFPLNTEAGVLQNVQRALLFGGIGLILLFAGIAWLVTRQIIQPVRHTARIAEMLAAGRLQERLAVRGTDELAKLGLSFNKMADSLQRQIRELEDLSRVQRRFVSDVSHELRTPLTTVRMAADVLHAARGDFPPAVSRSAELMQHELDRFEALLVDLLEISRHDARAAVLEADSVDVADLVQSVVDLSRSHSVRTECPLELRVPDDGPVYAEVDARRVQRIVRNLINNALEHGERQPVVVTVAASEDSVAIAVRDFGVGLRPGEATLVFNRFWRADAARARSSGGTGLGLAIALEDARLHGGWLQAWGEVGRGANFRLTVPRRAGEALKSSPIDLEPVEERPAEPDATPGSTTSRLSDRPTLLPVTIMGIGQPRPADPTPPTSGTRRG